MIGKMRTLLLIKKYIKICPHKIILYLWTLYFTPKKNSKTMRGLSFKMSFSFIDKLSKNDRRSMYSLSISSKKQWNLGYQDLFTNNFKC